MRELLKNILPQSLVSVAKQVRMRSFRGYLRYHYTRWRCRRIFLEANPLLKALTPQQELTVVLPGVGVARFSNEAFDAIEHFGWKDPSMVNEIKNFAALTRGKKCFIDVGANYGVFSVVFLCENEQATAFAIDPDPRAIRLLTKHAEMNQVGTRLQANNFALGRSSGIIQMRESGPHYVADFAENQPSDISVRVASLDELVTEHRLSPDCIKVDVEGFELEVLMGSLKTLQLCGPLLFLEIHPTSDGAMESELFGILQNHGYGIWDERDIRVDSPKQCAAEYSGSAFRVVARRVK